MSRQCKPLGDARRLLQDSVQFQAFAVQQPPQGDVSQLTDDPERLVQAEEHGEVPLPLPRADPDGLGHQAGGDPLQTRDLGPGDHKLDWRGERREETRPGSERRNNALHCVVIVRHVLIPTGGTAHCSTNAFK